MASGIYRIANTVNGKIYIGSGVSIERRFRDHRRELRAGTHCNQRLQRAWNKYGEGAFLFEAVELVKNKADLVRIETDHIERLDCCNPDVGYNLCRVGRSALGLRRTDETRAKMSAWQIGRVMSPEARANMSASRKGVPLPEERKVALRGIKRSDAFRARISEVLRMRPPPSDKTRAKISKNFLGKPLGNEHKMKLSVSHMGNKSALGHTLNEEARVQLSEHFRKLSDSDIAKIMTLRADGLLQREIAEMFGVTPSTVSNVLRKKCSYMQRAMASTQNNVLVMGSAA